MIARPSIASKRWVYEQYDSMVRTNTIVGPGSDAAVIRIKETGKAVALSTDCNARYVYLNPRRGSQIAVAEAARNVVCTGAKPVAITNCLNFGNPYDPEVYWHFREAVAGMGEACRILQTPVTGGNVSFYNENPEGAVYPTPVIGMLGLIEDVTKVLGNRFVRAGDVVVLLGATRGHLGGSEYVLMRHGSIAGDAPPIDLHAELRLQEALLAANGRGLLRSAHDLSEGGLAVAVAECCFGAGQTLGFKGELPLGPGERPDAALFGEDQSRVLVSCKPEGLEGMLDVAAQFRVPATVLGEVTGDPRMLIRGVLDEDMEALRMLYESSLGSLMGEYVV
jgi:phosphoribosylformylglycinamidine synthase